MPRFVLLRHVTPPHSDKPDHWDFMLESQGRLLTWNLETLPDAWAVVLDLPTGPGDTVDAVAIADHRLAYLDYEGPISGDRGSVRQIDAGTYLTTDSTPGAYHGELAGKRLRGSIALVPAADPRWRLTVVPETRRQATGG